MKIASANSGGARRASRSPASFHSFLECLPCLPSRWVGLGVLYPIILMAVLLTFRLTNVRKFMTLSCLWWSVNCSYRGGLKLRKLVNDWVFVFPRVISGDRGMVVGHWNDMYLFGEFLLGGSNAKKWGDHRKKNLMHVWLHFSTKLQKFTSFAWSWSNSEEYKILNAVVPDE